MGVLLGCWVLWGFKGFNGVLLGFVEYHKVLLSFMGVYGVFIGGFIEVFTSLTHASRDALCIKPRPLWSFGPTCIV